MLEITAQRAQEFSVKPQGDNESDSVFKRRVSEALRRADHIIEAHEAFNNAL